VYICVRGIYLVYSRVYVCKGYSRVYVCWGNIFSVQSCNMCVRSIELVYGGV
jgi:hypothetical protein